MTEPLQTTHPSEVRRLEAENVELKEGWRDLLHERGDLKSTLRLVERRASKAESDRDSLRLENEKLRDELDRIEVYGLLARGGRLVPIAKEVFDELDRKWSRAVEVAIKDGELIFRNVDQSAELDRLRQGIRSEVEHYREEAAKHRDLATRCKHFIDGEEQLRLATQDDARANRLGALLGEEGES